MSPCSPLDNTLNPPITPGIPIPGFGLPFAPLAFPLPDFDLPTDLLEDLIDLIKKLGALFPSGMFKPNPDGFMRDIMDAIASILNQIAPFLSFYNFIMAVLNLIICIIEVLCCIPDPFCLAIKLQKLFAECLPPFLALFPWLALIAMILALLLLILALILYIIELIRQIIEDLIRNIRRLDRAIQYSDASAALAIAQKIAWLLCYLQNIFAIFLALAAIMAIIQALMQFGGSSICGDEEGDEGCCGDGLCPDFIKEMPLTGYEGTVGRMVYYKKLVTDFGGLGLPPILEQLLGPIPPPRPERWQFLNDSAFQERQFDEIITPVLYGPFPPFLFPKIWYPEKSFNADTPPAEVPYLVDMRLRVNPAAFGHTDPGGERYMKIKDCSVVRKPYIGEVDDNNVLQTVGANLTGTLNLEGGLVYEDDDSSYMIGSDQATLNTLIHDDDFAVSTWPANLGDGYEFTNIEFSWRTNHGAMVQYGLITIGCMPGVYIEKVTQNAKYAAEGFEPVLDKLQNVPDGQLVPSVGILPNVSGTQQCADNAVAEVRKDVSIATLGQLQATLETCLGDLEMQTLALYCDALAAAVSQFNSTIELDVDLQFTTRAIVLSVILKDGGGTVLSNNIPPSCAGDILDKLDANVTFGEVTDFVYDGYGPAITALITSEIPGDGVVTVTFDGKVFSKVINGGSLTDPSSIIPNAVPYTFIDAIDTPAVRRDVTDVSNSGG